ncbi:hypothetical protein [Flavobacterium sp.]|uniref:DUF6952 family protein n=1 Tax=Flavobacterium sp. TaxID=239 RepID=UPI002617E130|nr:hypothetical protein [Flavobacterium sp.]
MKLPVIKHLTQFIEDNDQDYIIETIEVLEHLTEIETLKDEELDVLGELISNLYGALEVHKMIKDGKDKKTALNDFMQRVLGSIDK